MVHPKTGIIATNKMKRIVWREDQTELSIVRGLPFFIPVRIAAASEQASRRHFGLSAQTAR
jgi:hypothetical protein